MKYGDEKWYQIAANTIFGLGEVGLDEIQRRLPEMDRQQIRSALKHARQRGMVITRRRGNDWTFEAPLNAPNSVWQLPAFA